MLGGIIMIDKMDRLSTLGKILIAEDNAVNQKLMKKFFEKSHLDFLIVDNGYEAVKVCEEESISLILMDCQMPVMDGFEATKEIRKKHGDEMTIVAMTAFASKEVEKSCTEAGMNLVLTKPIDLDELEAILEMDIQKEPEHIQYEEQAMSIREKEIQIFRSKINFDYKTTSDLFDTFIKQIRSGLKDIESHIINQDYKEALHKAHQLKGAAASLRIERIRNRLEKIEVCLEETKLDELQKLIKEIGEDSLIIS